MEGRSIGGVSIQGDKYVGGDSTSMVIARALNESGVPADQKTYDFLCVAQSHHDGINSWASDGTYTGRKFWEEYTNGYKVVITNPTTDVSFLPGKTGRSR